MKLKMKEKDNYTNKIPNCKCGHLLDLSSCITERFNARTNSSIFIQLSKEDWVEVEFCPYCGGKNLDQVYSELVSMTESCNCKTFSTQLTRANTNVKFDNTLKAFFLATDTDEYILCNYCVVCGKPISEFYDIEVILPPSQNEIDKANNLISSLESIQNSYKFWGKPDFVQEPEMFIFNNYVPKMWQKIKMRLIFSSIFKSFEITVTEYQSGKIGVMFNFKTKPQ